ncbi:NAD-dependent epimerase/dehydratase family protein [Amylibacter sp.]|nr:NAD-dependent epimerase/dehydratase family protein [Amylibacter sp.]
MRVLITGANGFIGKNLVLHLKEHEEFDVVHFTREHTADDLPRLLEGVDWVFHLAGVNRPLNAAEFRTGNVNLTEQLCTAIEVCGSIIPIVYTSSIQAEQGNDYGISKLEAENILLDLQKKTGNPIYIYRLPNVFGKWARPDYNSVVATFCHNIARNLPIKVNDPSAIINMIYIDDLVKNFITLLTSRRTKSVEAQISNIEVNPGYKITVGDLLKQLQGFKNSRDHLVIEPVGDGLVRALYSTYVSYLPPERFRYTVQQYKDTRGMFVEMLKTTNTGQISFFTAHPGVTRGGHYHHSKTEKFLIVKGKALFRFRHMLTDDYYEMLVSGEKTEIIDSPPGWTHDLVNVGDDDLICLLWANETFDRDRPDTFVSHIF